MLKITQVKSAIDRKQDHKDTLRALGIHAHRADRVPRRHAP